MTPDWQIPADTAAFIRDTPRLTSRTVPVVRRAYYGLARARLQRVRLLIEVAREQTSAEAYTTLWLVVVDHLCMALQWREAARIQLRTMRGQS